MTLRADTVLYRVTQYEPYADEELPTWKVTTALVASASAKQIRLKTYFSGLFKKNFEPDALGHVFFESPLQAIKHFLTQQQLEIESLDRRRKEAERAIAWAAAQEGMSPS